MSPVHLAHNCICTNAVMLFNLAIYQWAPVNARRPDHQYYLSMCNSE